MNIHTLNKIEIAAAFIPNSLAEKKINKSKAFENLEFAKPGEGEFSREIVEKLKDLEAEVLTTIQAAKLAGVSKAIIMLRKKQGELPFEKIKGVLYFKREDVLNIEPETKEATEHLLTSKEAAEYISMKYDSFQHRKVKFKIPYTLKGKRNRMYAKEDLDQHLIDHARRNMDI